MAAPQKHALALIAQLDCPPSGQLASLQRAVLDQLALIKRMEGEAALRGILAGIGFHRVKNAMPRGEFRPWIESSAPVGKSHVNNLMRLASVFLEKSRTTKVELLAIPSDSAEIVTTDDASRRLLAKVLSFIGECSLNELLVKYGIKGVSREGDEGGDETSATAGDEGQLWFSEVAQHLYGFRQSVLKAESIMRMPPDKLREVLAEHNAQNAELKALCAKAGIS